MVFVHKQVILIRKDLGMGKGKIAAQTAHASLEAYRKASPRDRQEWEKSGSKKVILGVDSLREMLEIKRKAGEAGLPLALVRDAGRTEIPPGTVTALAIGPAGEEDIDRITGHLKML